MKSEIQSTSWPCTQILQNVYCYCTLAVNGFMRKNATSGTVFPMFFDVSACFRKGIEGEGLSRAHLRAKSANVQRSFLFSKRDSYNIPGKE